MVLESLLTYAHFVSILTMVVFLTSEAALLRVEWLNAAVVARLVRIDLFYGLAALAVLASGVARTVWGVKGLGHYWGNPLLYLKLALFLGMGLLSVPATLRFQRWHRALDNGGLPDAAQLRATRRLVLIEAHLLAAIPLAAVFFARGSG